MNVEACVHIFEQNVILLCTSQNFDQHRTYIETLLNLLLEGYHNILPLCGAWRDIRDKWFYCWKTLFFPFPPHPLPLLPYLTLNPSPHPLSSPPLLTLSPHLSPYSPTSPSICLLTLSSYSITSTSPSLLTLSPHPLLLLLNSPSPSTSPSPLTP